METIELMFPPGADGKAHPAFMFEPRWGRAISRYDYPLQNPQGIEIRTRSGQFLTLVAAAITHYWTVERDKRYEGVFRTGIEDAAHTVALVQASAWSAIAAGSREYDNCKIVEFKA